MTFSDDLAIALAIADLADAVTMQRYLASDLVVEMKPDLTPVTEADKATETLIREQLLLHRQNDVIVGEEEGGQATSGRRWIVDPIDGTKNYVRGTPVWATLIALVDEVDGVDEVVVGVVSAPALARRWWAAKGLGAHTRGPEAPDGRTMVVSKVREVRDASVSYSDDTYWHGDQLSRWTDLKHDAWRSRGYGDFWSHMLVAEGAVDAAIETDLSVWDVAALVVIVQEAGGTVTAIDGTNVLAGDSLVTSNTLLHNDVLSYFRG